MTTLIRKATLLTLDPVRGAEPFVGDLLIEGDRIAALAADLGEVPGAGVIDGRHRLVMPGLVNSHLHSGEALFKGRYDNLPLELWMLYTYPIVGGSALAQRLIYLRSMLVAIESLKTGVTTVTDDVFESPLQTLDTLGAVFQAYDDIGIRATVSGHVIDRNFLDTIPYTRDVIPPDVQGLVADLPSSAARDYLDFARAAFERFHGRSGRLRFMIAPSAPQRCTVELMQAADELARAHGSPFHTHILETKTQWVTGREFYGKSLIRYMHDLGLLYRGTTIAHSVWVTDEDIALMGAAQCSIVHNCISNQKLGAGVAPLRRLIDAGVNVALGSDGIASNDTPRIFDVMHAAGILHNVAAPDNSKWVSATEILQAATINGARSALIEGETGSLEPGKKADLLLVGMRGVNFTPLNDVRNHLVYCENGSSIERVFVNGETVVENGRLTRVNDEGLLDELRELLPAFQVEHAEVERKNRVFHPYFAEIHRRSTIQDIGINRYAGDLPLWPGANR